VDRHVHKAGEPVDEGGKPPGRLWTTVRACLAGVESALWRTVVAHVDRPAWRNFGKDQAPMAGLMPHGNREILHHGAEIALPRDLYLWHFASGA
jgi:hypothetical protein